MNSLRTLRDPTTEFGRDSQPNMMSRKKSLQTTLESSAQPVNQLLSEISNKAACNQPFSKFSIQNSTLRNQLAPLTFETDLISEVCSTASVFQLTASPIKASPNPRLLMSVN